MVRLLVLHGKTKERGFLNNETPVFKYMLNLETFYREQVGGLIDEINKSNLKKINTLTDSDKNFRDPEEHYCLYPLFIALSSIQTSLIDEKLKKDLQHLTTKLIKQKSSNWSFNYWVRGSKEAKVMPNYIKWWQYFFAHERLALE